MTQLEALNANKTPITAREATELIKLRRALEAKVEYGRVSQGGSGGCNRTAQGRACADGNLRRRGLLHSAARKKFDGRVCYRTDQKLARVDAGGCKQTDLVIPQPPQSVCSS